MVQSHKAKETNYLINILNLVYFMVVGKKDCHLYRHTPSPLGRHTPSRHPLWQTPPRDRHPQADTPCLVHAGIHPTVHAGIHPLPSACWDMVNKRAVRIPLECILVSSVIASSPKNTLGSVTMSTRLQRAFFPQMRKFLSLISTLPTRIHFQELCLVNCSTIKHWD